MRNFAKNALACVPVPGLVAALLLVAPGTAQAQAEILHACYMPATGVMYLIKLSGLPDACRSDDHVEIAFRTVSSASAQAAGPALAPGQPGGPPPDVGPKIVKSLNTLTGDLTLTGTGGTTIALDGLGAVEINTLSATDAIAAMGTAENDNLLNHNRYTDDEAIAAVGPGSDGHSLDAADGSPTDALFVDNDGNVGIGTISPTAKLDIVADGAALRVHRASAPGADVISLQADPAGGRISINDQSGSAKVAILSVGNSFFNGGNVGIGTTSPEAKLEVAGQIKITGGSPEAGKVLTSDATGLASWATIAGGGEGDITGVIAGVGLTGGGTSGDVIVSHADASAQASVNNSGGAVIQDITLDDFGHLTSLNSINLDARFVNVTGETMTGALTLPSDGLTVGTNQLVALGGNVGIGTTNPAHKLTVGDQAGTSPSNYLQINAATWAGIVFSGGGRGADITYNHAQNYLRFETSPGDGTGPWERMRITGAGKVGIGTNNPTEQLTVAGKILSTGGDGGFVFPDGSVQTTAATGGGAPDGVPGGVIVMWSGSALPAGWALCDGTNGTPNLLDRFIFGSALGDIGQSGGSTDHAHTVDSHSHFHDHPSAQTASPLGTEKISNDAGTKRVADQFHRHVVNLPTIKSDSRSPGTDTVDHLPPFYTLAFIMKL